MPDMRLAATTNSIVVTVQYRQGPFGYEYMYMYTVLDELLLSGHINLAAADQVGALRWVRRTIINFDGDAGQVSLMGQSAGAGFVLWGMCFDSISMGDVLLTFGLG